MTAYDQITKGSRIVTKEEYTFLKMMLEAIQDYYKFCEDKDKVLNDYGSLSNETYSAVEYAFEEGLVQ